MQTLLFSWLSSISVNRLVGSCRPLECADHAQLVELLVSKDKEMKSTLQLAADQAGIERKLDDLRDQVRDQDEEIKQLKEAEYILATSIFQARQKLPSFAKATKRPVSSDELIKFAHRKNASNAICAPLTWQQGDQDRPYPTDRDAAGLPLQFRPDLQRDQNPATQNSIGEINRTGAAVGSLTPNVRRGIDHEPENSGESVQKVEHRNSFEAITLNFNLLDLDLLEPERPLRGRDDTAATKIAEGGEASAAKGQTEPAMLFAMRKCFGKALASHR
ncbi:mediator complex [Culex quinquefasciatus]|uniref:Mediator of RNA polymerase II transcription subunit 4 n=1 Tax=Culex quinquefasciatus TaxID=7176 RepID=B0WV79_CULQU|nr:mediator complex [Culex quinquefasciatus]|eukprot:XP_001861301.1 mediator complex [Culex quinquefasciatus]